MTKSWQIKKLKEVSEMTYGHTDSASFKNIGPKFLRITDIQNNKVFWDSVPHCSCTEKEFSKYELEDDDIVFARTGATTGKSVMIQNPPRAVFASYLIRLKVNSKKEVLPKYLAFYFQTANYWEKIGLGLSGSAQGGFNASKLGELEMPIPSIVEQKYVVDVLHDVFAATDKAISNIERNLQNAIDIFECYLNWAFQNSGNEWSEKSLSSMCSISSKLIDPRKPEYRKFIHVGAGNIESTTGILSELKTAEEEKLISGKFLFDESMVLYSKIRPYLRKVVKCNFKGLCSADIYPLIPNSQVITKAFLYYLLLTKHFTEYAVRGSQRAGMPKVNREHLFSYRVSIPSIVTQELIVSNLDLLWEKSQKMQKIYQEKLFYLDNLKKSILQKAFSGELTAATLNLIT